jgi:nitroreductase
MHEINYNILKAICEMRRSVRNYLDIPVEEDLIERIKKIALTSPYTSGKKNWKILVVNDKESIHGIGRIVKNHSDEILKKVREDFRDGFVEYAENFTFFETAPVLFILTYRVPYALTPMLNEVNDFISEWERDNYVKSISCVAMLILLAAQSLDLGSCYMTGPLIAEKQIMEFLGINKGKNIGAIIPVGYPK